MLQLSFVVSGWSPEPEGKRHGCVLAIDGKYVLATGFNGPDRFHISSKTCPCADCQAPVIHAEVNSLINLRELLGWRILPSNTVAFVTKKPCEDCMQALKDAQVSAIMWLQDLSSADATWVRP